MRVVVALGGNALLRRGERPDAAARARALADAARAVAAVARAHEVVVTHGNGPQVGLLALQAEAAGQATPLDVLDAESEGLIGYPLERELRAALPGREVAALLTQVLVDAADPAFAAPTKPIGPLYGEAEARRVAAARGWAVAADGPGWRRVVPSPEPRALVEAHAIRLLVDAGVLLVCAGGGGIPVVDRDGALAGVEAVVDKDLAAELLARTVDADALLLLTDVAAVERDFGTPAAEPIREATVAGLRAAAWAPGSMGPKVEAACRFVEATGGLAAIGALEDAPAVLAGERGTRVRA
ncbi:MAG: carbamate kinase [Thermoleophilia bacterium]